MEIPTLIQPGDREDAIARILEARTPSGTLLGPDSWINPPPQDSLLRYRSLVNQVHPDRCLDTRAERAFLRASLAFDTICAWDSTLDLNAPDLNSNAGWAPDSESSKPARASRWWHTGSIADLDRCLEFRTVAMNTLNALLPNLPAGFVSLLACVKDAERVCEHLDRSKSIKRSRYWPSNRPKYSLNTDEAQRLGIRLLDLLCHLRTVHRFCQLLGRSFDHPTELEAVSSPTSTPHLLQLLLKKELRPTPALTQLVGPASAARETDASMGEDDDIDPLDAFMANLEAENSGDAQPAVSSAAVLGSNARPIGEANAGQSNAGTAHLITDAIFTAQQSHREQCSVIGQLDGRSRDLNLVLGPFGSKAKQGTAANSELRLLTGKVLHLASDPIATENKSDALGSEEITTSSKQQDQIGLQNQLLGDLDSEDSELEDVDMSSRAQAA